MKTVNDLNNCCNVCLKSEKSRKMKKFWLLKLNLELNDAFEIDIMYCGSTKVLHAVGTATGYSELFTFKNRCLNTITNTIDNIWLLKHDATKIISGRSRVQ